MRPAGGERELLLNPAADLADLDLAIADDDEAPGSDIGLSDFEGELERVIDDAEGSGGEAAPVPRVEDVEDRPGEPPMPVAVAAPAELVPPADPVPEVPEVPEAAPEPRVRGPRRRDVLEHPAYSVDVRGDGMCLTRHDLLQNSWGYTL